MTILSIILIILYVLSVLFSATTFIAIDVYNTVYKGYGFRVEDLAISGLVSLIPGINLLFSVVAIMNTFKIIQRLNNVITSFLRGLKK